MTLPTTQTSPHRPSRRILSVIGASLLTVAAGAWGKTVLVGGSGGSLNYPDAQTTLGLSAGDTIGVRAGTYTGLNFGKLRGTSLAKIHIVNQGGVVDVTGGCNSCSSNLTDAVHVRFSGTGAPGVEYGFWFHDLPYRGLQLNGSLDSTHVENLRFENVKDLVIRVNANKVYDGTPGTLIQGMKFSHLYVKNSSAAIDWGDYNAAADFVGVGRDIEIFDNIIDSSQQGTGFRLNKVFEANIHHNTITRMGLGLTSTHPGTIMLRGDGRVHHNVIRNVWGVCSRNFGCGLGRTGKVDVFNNIFLGSRKYSAIEANSLFSDTTSRAASPFVGNADYRFYNNTIGNQQASDFTAAMVDVYTLLGGRCEIKNNLGFHIAADKPYSASNNYVYNLENPNPPDTARNLYRHNPADLGLEDTVNVRLLAGSLAIDKGLDLALVTDDFSGLARPQGTATDIGAREFSALSPIGARRPSRGNSRILRTSTGWQLQATRPIHRVGVAHPDGRTQWMSNPLWALTMIIPANALQGGVQFLSIQTDHGTEILSLPPFSRR